MIEMIKSIDAEGWNRFLLEEPLSWSSSDTVQRNKIDWTHTKKDEGEN